jgi:hypothetical protein
MITIFGVGPKNSSFPFGDPNHSTSGRILSVAISADPNRIYAGSFAGVWRSDDAGHTFHQLIGTLTDTAGPGIFGGIYAPHIFDLAASPTDPNVVLGAALDGRFETSRDGIYRSDSGGITWELIFPTPVVSQVLFAPDDPSLVLAALGPAGIARSVDAGKTWTVIAVPGNAWHVAVAPQEGPGVRKVYAAGDSSIFFSPDGGNTWFTDNGVATVNTARRNLAIFQSSCGSDEVGGFAGQSTTVLGSNPQVLAVEPGNPAKVYLATVGGSLGRCYYDPRVPDGTQVNTVCQRLAGEGSLWYGDFSQFAAAGAAQWVQLPGPPVYNGGGETPSGNVYVITKRTSAGFLVFFSDMGHVHVAQGSPAGLNSWHRLGGKDVSQAQKDGEHGNVLFVHADPHGLIFTPDFEITLKPATGVSFPFDQNTELDQYVGGTIWMANDGGIRRSDDGGRTWETTDGLETLDPVNIAGLFGIGNTPALYFGCGDNDDFFTPDGGQHWFDPISSCGDCDCWFSDVAQPSRVLQFEPRFFVGPVRTPKVNIISAEDSSHYPDPSDSSHTRHIPATLRVRPPGDIASEYTQSGNVLRGYRPIIQTLATESPLPDGDYVFIHSSDGVSRKVLRTTSLSSISTLSDWDDPNKAQQIGTLLRASPNGTEPVLQAAGGHANPVFYAGYDTGVVVKWDDNSGTWKTIVPGGPPGRSASQALSFFVNPYDPAIIYLVDKLSGIKLSLDGGASWLPDARLAQAVSANRKIKNPSPTVISDMLFLRGEERTRFVFGDAGVFCTLDGFNWITLLDAIAIPGRPESGFFDPISDPNDRALYVELEGRSVLRLGGIPGPPPFQPPPEFDLLEFAAILEA